MVKNCPERLSREKEKWVWFNMLHATAGFYCMYWQLQTESVSRRTRTRMEQQNQDPTPSTRNRAGSSSGSTRLEVSVEDMKDTRTSVEAPCILHSFCFSIKCGKSVKVCFSLLKTAKCFLVSSPLSEQQIQMCLDWTCAAGWMICWKKISGQIVLALSLQIWEVQGLIFIICVYSLWITWIKPGGN